MCPRRNKSDNSKQQERETRQQERKSRARKAHPKAGDDDDERTLKNQLRAFNLQLRNIVGDGNCLFRCFADQMEGDQHRHSHYREQICDFMRIHRQDFEAFIVDQSFDAFIRSISKDGTYGGNECIVACSRLFDAKICIHQLNQPIWTVCFSDSPKHEIHIWYHSYEHYSSIRQLGDRTYTSANIRQSMTTCDPSTINKKTTNNTNQGACAIDPTELFGDHDIDYILSQLTNPVDRQLIRDTLADNHGDIDGTIAHLLALDIPSSPLPPPTTPPQQSNDSIERIMATTGIYDVDLIQQSLANNNLDIDSTVESLLKLTIDDKVETSVESSLKLTTDDKDETSENEEITNKTKTKNRSVSTRQVKIDKKKAKKERATEKHRAQVLAASGKTSAKQSEEKTDSPVNNEQEQIPPANMEFINI